MTLIRLSSPAIRCIGPGPIRVYYEPSPRAVSVTRLEFRDQISFCSCLVPRLLRHFGSLVTWVLRVPLSSGIGIPQMSFLTQEHLDAICAKYFIPEEVHPQLPRSDATVHERPAGKVGMYTRFFDYANYRIPFSTFFVSVLIHFGIPFSKLSNLDSVKNWNDHFFMVDEFVVPANARFSWFSGSNIIKDRAPAPSEYNVEHVNTLIAQASPFLRFPEEFLCWVGISRNYLLNKDTYLRFEYENGEEMDLNAFICTADPYKVRIVKRARAKNERPIVTVAKHRTVTLLPNSVVRYSGELSASMEREFVGDANVGDGRDQGLLQDSRLLVEQGIPALPTLPFITSSVIALPLEEGGDHTDSMTGPSLRTVGPSARFIVLFDSSHHSGAKSADPEVDSLVRYAAPVMTEATTVATIATMVAIPVDVGKDKSAPHPSVFGSSSSSEKTDRTLSLFTGRRSKFLSGRDQGGLSLLDGHYLVAKMNSPFTPPAFFENYSRNRDTNNYFAEYLM
ncbi:hypothetical protein Tco_1002724 [Tanacetum coccineum]|uniref:Uncharacterized protein n=1 Tax=Tanacetum coccineum TaxID=301880 RepID=A0ABQ5F717_9ASTR